MIEFQQIIFLSIVQGITEFLPISSSAHLIFIPKIFNWNDQGILFDIAMHFGSLLAILFYYIKHQKDFIDSNTSKNYLSANKLVIGSIPVLLFGFIFYDYIKINLRSVEVIGITTIIFAILLIVIEYNSKRIKILKNITYVDIIIIGLFQSIALIPGTSRSAIIIIASLLLGYDKKSSIIIAIMLSFPVILAAMIHEIIFINFSDLSMQLTFQIIISIVVTAITAYILIKYFITYISKIGFYPFMIYRIILGSILLLFFV